MGLWDKLKKEYMGMSGKNGVGKGMLNTTTDEIKKRNEAIRKAAGNDRKNKKGSK